MLTDDDIAQHFAVRLVYAIASGATRAADQIDHAWRRHVALAEPCADRAADPHAGMRDVLDRIAADQVEPTAPSPTGWSCP